MDKREIIQLGEQKHVDSINEDVSIKIKLDGKYSLNTEYEIENVLNVTKVFDDERQNTYKYKIHGEIEYLSVLTNLNFDYNNVEDFFSTKPLSAETKTLFSDFKIYLVAPSSSGWTETSVVDRYRRKFIVLEEFNNIDILNAGFAKNIFDETQQSFVLNFDVDIENLSDNFGFPITEVFLYFEYQTSQNGNGDNEILSHKTFNSLGNDATIANISNMTWNKGDVIEGDIVDFFNTTYEQIIYNKYLHYITTPYLDGVTKHIKWYYNPFVPIRLRYFEEDVRVASTGTSDYALVSSIPSHAIPYDNNGNYVWRDILENGFFDPVSEIGVNFPFINQRHYVFNNLVFSVKPDLTHSNTNIVFNEIKFNENTFISAKPSDESNLDKIGKDC